MALKGNLKNIFTKLGENNKPTYAVMAIALVKGIARPLFTMSDKHADPKTKKYTAIREWLTEVVAIPTYFACGELAGKVADKLNFEKLPTEELRKYARKNAKQNFMFLGVCTAAFAIIPALASVAVKPFVKKMQENDIDDKDEKIKNATKLDINDVEKNSLEENNSTPVFKSSKQIKASYQIPITHNMTGMKVGGV